MNKTIVFKAMALGLCAALCFSMGACGYLKPDDTRPYEEETEEIGDPEKTEGTTEESATTTTVETTEETTETSETETTADPYAIFENNPYEEFINGYKDALENPTDTWYYGPGVDTSDYMNLGQGIIVAEQHNGFSYTLFDFDKDGTLELVIGFESDNDENDTRIWITGIVTIFDGEYKIVAAGWDRSSLSYVGNGYFVNSGSGGAALHYDIVFKYDDELDGLSCIGALVTEYDTGDAENPHYSYFASEKDAYSAFPAYGDSRAVCFDQEAADRFNSDLELAYSQDNELVGSTWIRVDF